jgi:hypothetical protein
MQRWASVTKVVHESYWSSERPKASSEVLDLDRRTDMSYSARFGEKMRAAGSKSQMDLELRVE